MTSNTTRNRVVNSLSYAFLIVMSLLVLLPLLWMVLTALKSMQDITMSRGLNILPSKFEWSNFTKLWNDYPMLAYLKNSLVTVMGSTILMVICTTLCGFGLARFEFKVKEFFLSFLLVTQMFPAVMKIVPYYQILSKLGLVNTNSGLTVVYTSFVIPFCTWMIYGYFRTIPKGLDEAARIDGCGWFTIFWRIILPLVMPGLIATTIYAFLQNWNEYMFASVLTTAEVNKTLPVGIGQMADAYKIEWNSLMCASIISSVPSLILFLFLQKHLISGMTAGAIKE